MTKSFIDTNIMVHWMILNKLKDERPNMSEFLKEFKKIKPSFELIEIVKQNTIENQFYFTSSLSTSEIFYAILDEYRCRKMHLDGVPLSSWQRTKEKVELKNEDKKTLTNDIITFLKEFGIIEPMEKNKRISLLTEHFDYLLISKLVFENKIRTHDAILISTAINYGCDYFITGDRTLRDENKMIKEIEIISPQKSLQIIKSNTI